MELSQDFKEFIASLNASRVRYLVVGGYAVAMHGHPRYTKDLDVWVDCTAANAKRMVRAFAEFGFASLGVKASDFEQPDRMLQMGFPPNRIDVLTSLAGVDFATCFKRRVIVEFDGVPVNFIDVENLKANKRAAGRLQDLADVEKLES
ncbi:MAG: hypothetical protein FD138_401 [Planctomycetota bacterium]|nr:MAG: hypothetical protein FD138_401 [Planctomycetota bacterium]